MINGRQPQWFEPVSIRMDTNWSIYLERSQFMSMLRRAITAHLPRQPGRAASL
jgi:hypothetical protein